MGKGKDTRQSILEHAVRKAAKVGLMGLTIGELSRELSMSKSGLFSHFGSKEALQAAVVDFAAERFTDDVIRPALKAPRGEPRVRALFEGWFAWYEHVRRKKTGCLFIAAASELDDRPGTARERLVAQQRDLTDFMASVVQVAIREGHFRTDLDPEQFAFEAHGVIHAYHLSDRLLDNVQSRNLARKAVERLIADAKRFA